MNVKISFWVLLCSFWVLLGSFGSFWVNRCTRLSRDNHIVLLGTKWRPRRQLRVWLLTVFLCFTKNATCFKLSGRRAIKENFQEKLNNIIGQTYQHELMRRDAMVCRNCYSRVISVNDFIEKCKHSSQSF